MKQPLRALFVIGFTLFSFSVVNAFGNIADEGCIPVATNTINADNPQGDIPQSAENDINSVVFFPNPVKSFLTVRFPRKGNFSVTIYNIIGDKVLTKTSMDDNEIHLDVSDLQNGLYFISYEFGGKVLTKRFSKIS